MKRMCLMRAGKEGGRRVVGPCTHGCPRDRDLVVNGQRVGEPKFLAALRAVIAYVSSRYVRHRQPRRRQQAA